MSKQSGFAKLCVFQLSFKCSWLTEKEAKKKLTSLSATSVKCWTLPFTIYCFLLPSCQQASPWWPTLNAASVTWDFFYLSFDFYWTAVAFRVLVERGKFNRVSVNSWTETEPKKFILCGWGIFFLFCFLKKGCQLCLYFWQLTVDIRQIKKLLVCQQPLKLCCLGFDFPLTF